MMVFESKYNSGVWYLSSIDEYYIKFVAPQYVNDILIALIKVLIQMEKIWKNWKNLETPKVAL